MADILRIGDCVRHNKKADWGVGKIVSIEKGGTIRVIFQGNNNVSIARGAKFLTKSS